MLACTFSHLRYFLIKTAFHKKVHLVIELVHRSGNGYTKFDFKFALTSNIID